MHGIKVDNFGSAVLGLTFFSEHFQPWIQQFHTVEVQHFIGGGGNALYLSNGFLLFEMDSYLLKLITEEFRPLFKKRLFMSDCLFLGGYNTTLRK